VSPDARCLATLAGVSESLRLRGSWSTPRLPAPLVTCGASLLGVSAFAFQGTNAHLVLQAAAAAPAATAAAAAMVPWARRRVWVHPRPCSLLTRASAPKAGGSATFQLLLGHPAHAALWDHLVGGRALVPGAALLELAARAVAVLAGQGQAGPGAVAAIRGISIPSPALLPAPGGAAAAGLSLFCQVDLATGGLEVSSRLPSGSRRVHLRAASCAVLSGHEQQGGGGGSGPGGADILASQALDALWDILSVCGSGSSTAPDTTTSSAPARAPAITAPAASASSPAAAARAVATLARSPAAGEDASTNCIASLDSLLQLGAVARAWALAGRGGAAGGAALVPVAAEAYICGLEGAGGAALAGSGQLFAAASVRPGDLRSSMRCDYLAGGLSSGCAPVCRIAGLEARAVGSLAAPAAEGPAAAAAAPRAAAQAALQQQQQEQEEEQEDSFAQGMLYGIRAVASEPALAAAGAGEGGQLVLQLASGGGCGAPASALAVAQQVAALGGAAVSLLGGAQLAAAEQLGGAAGSGGGALLEAGVLGLLKTLRAEAGVAAGALGGAGGGGTRLVLQGAQAGVVAGAEQFGSSSAGGLKIDNALELQVGPGRSWGLTRRWP
jgi:hypothetical protein